MLVPAEGHPGRASTVLLCGPQDQRAPAAADVEEALARLDHELVEDMIELLLLGELERIVLAPEIGAGVHHVPVEPKGIEVVRDVVVVVDGVTVALAVVPPEPPQAAAA